MFLPVTARTGFVFYRLEGVGRVEAASLPHPLLCSALLCSPGSWDLCWACGRPALPSAQDGACPLESWEPALETACPGGIGKMTPSPLLKHKQFLALLQSHSWGFFFFLKTAAAGRVLRLHEQQAWAKAGASLLLSTWNLLTSVFYFPHSHLPTPALLVHMGLMSNSAGPGIT